ncbi:hypothetical protein HY496_01330 [Candidatus Woesearchaeota archaeon]|nr:hypothetical protein [Candidatus Woesearchaeota archaeon]
MGIVPKVKVYKLRASLLKKMQLEINFNDPDLLYRLLDQSLPQLEVEDQRIVIGENGGLTFLLFDELYSCNKLPRELNADTLNQMASLRAYVDTVGSYVEEAGKHAHQFGFGLVVLNSSTREIFSNPTLDSETYNLGIGDATIESLERFRDFLDMVKQGDEKFKPMYAHVIDAAKKLR